jgi:PAS domain S-box-containing protein
MNLEKKTKAELIQEIERLKGQIPENGNGQNGEGHPGKFNEQELLDLGVANAGEEMYVATNTGQIVYSNELFADELGYSMDELLSCKIPDIDPKHSRAKWLHFVSKLKNNEKPISFNTGFIIKDGGSIEMGVVASYITYKGKNFVLCQGKISETVADEDDENGMEQHGDTNTIRVLLNTVTEGVFFVDMKGEIVESNATAERMLGYSKYEIIGKLYSDPRWRMVDAQGNPITISDHPLSIALVSEAPVSNKRIALAQPNGLQKLLFFNAAPLFDATGTLTGAICGMRYVSGNTEMQQGATASVQLRDRVGEIARRFTAATTVDEMERTVCDILSESHDYGIVWVGKKEADESKVEISYSVGDATDYLLKIKERADDSDFGNGPTGMAIKTKKFQVVNDVESSASFQPWRRQAHRSSLQAFAAFPIILHDKVYGVLCLAAKDRNHFTTAETSYLNEVAQFLSFGIQGLRDAELNAVMEEHSILNNLLVETYMQNSDAAVAVFEAKEPYLCISTNKGFQEMLDEPYRSTGVKDSLLMDFAFSHIHKGLYDVFAQACEDVEPQANEAAEFNTFDGETQLWNWVVFPIMHGETVLSILYFATKSSGTEGSTESNILGNLPASVYSIDFEKRLMRYANPSAQDHFGLVEGLPALHAIPFLSDIAKTKQKAITEQLDLLTSGKSQKITFSFSLKTGSPKKSRKFRQLINGEYSSSGILRGVNALIIDESEG